MTSIVTSREVSGFHLSQRKGLLVTSDWNRLPFVASLPWYGQETTYKTTPPPYAPLVPTPAFPRTMVCSLIDLVHGLHYYHDGGSNRSKCNIFTHTRFLRARYPCGA